MIIHGWLNKLLYLPTIVVLSHVLKTERNISKTNKKTIQYILLEFREKRHDQRLCRRGYEVKCVNRLPLQWILTRSCRMNRVSISSQKAWGYECMVCCMVRLFQEKNMWTKSWCESVGTVLRGIWKYSIFLKWRSIKVKRRKLNWKSRCARYRGRLVMPD